MLAELKKFWRCHTNAPDFSVQSAEDDIWFITPSDWTATCIGSGYKVLFDRWWPDGKDMPTEKWSRAQKKQYYRNQTHIFYKALFSSYCVFI